MTNVCGCGCCCCCWASACCCGCCCCRPGSAAGVCCEGDEGDEEDEEESCGFCCCCGLIQLLTLCNKKLRVRCFSNSLALVMCFFRRVCEVCVPLWIGLKDLLIPSCTTSFVLPMFAFYRCWCVAIGKELSDTSEKRWASGSRGVTVLSFVSTRKPLENKPENYRNYPVLHLLPEKWCVFTRPFTTVTRQQRPPLAHSVRDTKSLKLCSSQETTRTLPELSMTYRYAGTDRIWERNQ